MIIHNPDLLSLEKELQKAFNTPGIYTIIAAPSLEEAQLVRECALECAKGSYQCDIILGAESQSGSTLRGKASTYGARYKESRENLLCRFTRQGIPWYINVGRWGRMTLVIGITMATINEILSRAA